MITSLLLNVIYVPYIFLIVISHDFTIKSPSPWRLSTSTNNIPFMTVDIVYTSSIWITQKLPPATKAEPKY